VYSYFYDSTQPGKIPAGAHACLYYDGLYKATAEQAERFPAVRWITVLGNAKAGVADFEQGNAVYSRPGELRAWVTARAALVPRYHTYVTPDPATLAAWAAKWGHPLAGTEELNPRLSRTAVLPKGTHITFPGPPAGAAADLQARVYCDLSNLPVVRKELEGLPYQVWLATLDGNKLHAGYTEDLWGVQYAGGVKADYDTSVLYGTW
jgi:hypothetical protein